jgi:hypothetical protein
MARGWVEIPFRIIVEDAENGLARLRCQTDSPNGWQNLDEEPVEVAVGVPVVLHVSTWLTHSGAEASAPPAEWFEEEQE